ncbi:hypothetical protein PC111_g18807 [Phytophthora cactorum]|nr:hypothetical protein PC111_g18807 [Phytophthora cactorum]
MKNCEASRSRHCMSAPMQVLTNQPLFEHVVSFMDGLPLVVAKFARAQRYKPRLEGRYPSSRGLLPQLAVICDDFVVLAALLKLVKNYSSSYRNPETEFYGVVRCAVRFDKLKTLQWLERNLDMGSYDFEVDLMDIAVGYTKGVKYKNNDVFFCDVRTPHYRRPRLRPPLTSGPTTEQLTQLQAAFNLPAELGLWRAYMTSVKTAKGDIIPLMDRNDAGSKFSTTRRRTGMRPASSIAVKNVIANTPRYSEITVSEA